MNWVDVLVLLLAVLAAISGFRQGVIIALPALIGTVIGAIVGIKVAPLVVELFDNAAAKVAFAVAAFVFLVALGETLGAWAGRKIRQRINPDRTSRVDGALGAVVQGAVVFVVAWLIALPLTTVNGLPGLSRAINDSAILGGVDQAMPDVAKGLPAELRKLLDASDLPNVVSPFQRAPSADTSAPDSALSQSAVVRQVRGSVVKIRGNASSCSRSLEGSGFVVAPQRVMTNAHVVAGTDEVAVETTQGRLPARVVHFDPEIDVAVLAVPRLDARALPFAAEAATGGDSAIVLGFPLDGPYTATAARIRQRINLRGPDIYDSSTVQRDVFAIRATIKSGNSGGPMLDPGGQVIGVVFGASVDNPDTGFTLTADEVRTEVAQAPAQGSEVSTGSCAA